jgi:aromatic ring-opening dioxygenase catalytic subunit (LigB family)
MTAFTLPAFYLSHGGGPWPWVEGRMRLGHQKLELALKQVPKLTGAAPKAVLMISAHWEAADFTFMSNPHPPMLYDYGGFPESTYHVSYPAPGAPLLGEKAQAMLAAAGIQAGFDPARGFDHGTFVPLAVIYPDADVPVLQLSLKRGLSPVDHLAAGRALAPLRKEGVLIIGSGSSYHNLGMSGPRAKAPSILFDDWLQRTMALPSGERTAALESWQAAPSARAAHPREEHLLPLMVVAGAAEADAATRFYNEDTFFGSRMSSFMFGGS